MTSPREHLIDWLRDAHALEEQAKSLLQAQIDRLEHYPEALPRLKQHLQETEQQRSMVESCLKDLGADTSTLKDWTTKFLANMQGFGHMMASDEILKHALASHAFERFEAASYHSLIKAAEVAQEPRVAQMARDILAQEEAMADWVWQNIPDLTEKFLRRSASDRDAKI
jgi:ferritin-like metal-binding protein YciE